jgi:hypothetical protein
MVGDTQSPLSHLRSKTALQTEGSFTLTLDRAYWATAYLSEHKAPAAQLNGADAASALLGSLDLKARHLPHDLRTVTLRTVEALCSLALILTS